MGNTLVPKKRPVRGDGDTGRGGIRKLWTARGGKGSMARVTQVVAGQEPVAVFIHESERLAQLRHLLADLEPAELAVVVEIGLRKTLVEALGALSFALRPQLLVVAAQFAAHHISVTV